MIRIRLAGMPLAVTLAMLACPLFGQKREIQELQRDMALLQDEVRGMNERLTNLSVMVEQLLDRMNSTNTSVTVLDSNLKDSLKQQQAEIAAPVAAMGAKVDKLSNEFRFVRESVEDLNSRVGKIQAQMTDLKTSVQVLLAPPPPPAPAGTVPAAGMATGLPPPAEVLYNNAQRDQSGGRLDLALMQYQDFLKTYPNADLAPDAEYAVGEIHFSKGDYRAAAAAFDLVLEKYPDNRKTADAMLMKARSLQEAGDTRGAAVEFRNLVKRYPDTPLAARAREELAKLGR